MYFVMNTLAEFLPMFCDALGKLNDDLSTVRVNLNWLQEDLRRERTQDRWIGLQEKHFASRDAGISDMQLSVENGIANLKALEKLHELLKNVREAEMLFGNLPARAYAK